MTNLDWYERVVENLPQELYDVCDLAKELILSGQLQIYTSKLDKHPTISVVVSFTNGEYTEEPFVIHFDPYNQEFYTLVPEDDEEVELRLMLRDTKEIIGFIHDQLHIAHMAFEHGEMIMDLDGNEHDAFQQFVNMIQTVSPEHQLPPYIIPMPSSNDYNFAEYPVVDEDEEIGFENLNGREIEWIPKSIVTESITKEDEQLQQVTSIRIGKFVDIEIFVLGRVDSITIDGDLDAEYGELFAFKKDEIAALKEVFKAL